MAAATVANGGAGIACMWFRCDLRVDDNPALVAACRTSAPLLPVYVFDPSHFNTATLAGARKSSARRARFLLESVACLRRRLEASGSGLAVGLGRPEDVLHRLCSGYKSLYLQQSVCSEEKAEEARVTMRLPGCKLERHWGGTLYLPEECGQSPDRTPTVFTSFRIKAESRGQIRRPLDAPRQLPALPRLDEEASRAFRFLPTLQELGFGEAEANAAYTDDPRGVLRFEGGEDAALERMRKWIWDADKLKDYVKIRNGMLGEGYSSKFSPWLALGCLSPRRAFVEAQRYESERVKNKSTYWFVFELKWRDFFIYMGRTNGDKIFFPGGLTGERRVWRKSEEALRRWKLGQTGDPLVDANMRELLATGWMSNRGRQNVASYLIFDLGVDWRYGAAHFEEHLLDHDPCSNWGNWVAAAGLTGPRVKKFNTTTQLNHYDPHGSYVRHWLQGETRASGPYGPGAAGAAVAAGARAEAEGMRQVQQPQQGQQGQSRLERFGIRTGGQQPPASKGAGKSAPGGCQPAACDAAGDAAAGGKRGRWRRVEDAQLVPQRA